MLENVVVLCPQEVVSIEAPAVTVSPEDQLPSAVMPVPEDSVEEMVVYLAAVEAAWSAGEFARLEKSLDAIARLTDRIGLKDVSSVAMQAMDLVDRQDEVALAAVVARLVRVGEASLATLLEYSFRPF